MKNRKNVGLDKWKVQTDIQTFLSICRRNRLELYDITIHQNFIQFYASCLQRPNLYRSFENIERMTTTGMLGYLFRSLKKPSRILALILSCCLWYGLSHVVFAVEIKGEKEECRQLIKSTLKQMNYEPPFYAQNVNDIKMKLKKQLENEIAWLEISKQGSRYRITYTPKEFASISKLSHDELIAQEDGVIVRFDLQHGNKKYKVHDFVHKGDVLVSNVLDDSKGKKEEVYVKGRVFAYTWKDITVTMDRNKLPKSFNYFELLLQARGEVSKNFKKDDKIYKENILQFSNDMGKIKMVIHYTLMKDITTP